MDRNGQAYRCLHALADVFGVHVIELILEVKLIGAAEGDGHDGGRVVHHIPRGAVRKEVLEFLNNLIITPAFPSSGAGVTKEGIRMASSLFLANWR